MSSKHLPISTRPVVLGCSGLALTQAEQKFFHETNPWGFILFKRNIDTPEQIKQLIANLRAAVDRSDAPILIDQEGGRVQRLRPPHWHAIPTMADIGRVYENNSAEGINYLEAAIGLIAYDLHDLAINYVCAPVADCPIDGADQVIGDRAFSTSAQTIIELCQKTAEIFLNFAITPIIKHIPGHGRAMCDSHLQLPSVAPPHAQLSQQDFKIFKKLNHLPFAMTAHIIYSDIDPDHPSTHSAKIINQIIRQEIGFDGILITDDLSMEALSGNIEQRAINAQKSGCDLLLHCNGNLDEMKKITAVIEPMSTQLSERIHQKSVRNSHVVVSENHMAHWRSLLKQHAIIAASENSKIDPTIYK